MTEHLDENGFKKHVFDWNAHEDWKYEGTMPAIVDFYAEWCGPCKMLGPVLEELSGKYEGKLKIFKVDVDKEPNIAGLFGVESVPTLLFIPKDGKPSIALGALPKPQLERAIGEVLMVS